MLAFIHLFVSFIQTSSVVSFDVLAVASEIKPECKCNHSKSKMKIHKEIKTIPFLQIYN